MQSLQIVITSNLLGSLFETTTRRGSFAICINSLYARALYPVRAWINPCMCYIITNTLSISKRTSCTELCSHMLACIRVAGDCARGSTLRTVSLLDKS